MAINPTQDITIALKVKDEATKRIQQANKIIETSLKAVTKSYKEVEHAHKQVIMAKNKALKLQKDLTVSYKKLAASNKDVAAANKRTAAAYKKAASTASQLSIAKSKLTTTTVGEKAATNSATNAQEKAAVAKEKAIKQYGRFRIATKGLREDLGRMRNELLLLTFAYQMLKRFIIPTVEAYSIQERAEIRLHTIMVKRNKESEGTYKSALMQAKGLQIVTNIGDEQILSMRASLETMKNLSSEQKDRLVPLILDLARASERATGEQVDLERVSRAVMRAMQGSSRSLLELGVDLGNFKRGALTAGQVINLLSDKVGGLSEEITSYSDSIKGTAASLGDLKEEIGKRILSFYGPAIDTINYQLKLQNAATEGLRILKEYQDVLPPSKTKGFQVMIDRLSKADKKKLKQMEDMKARQLHVNKMHEINVNTIRLGNRLRVESLKQLKEEAAILSERLKTTPQGEIGIKMLTPSGEFTTEWIDQYSQLSEKLADVNIKIEELKKKIKEATGGAVSLYRRLKDALSEYGLDIDVQIKSIAESMESTMSTYFFDSFTRQTKKAKEYFADFGRSMLKILSDVFARMVLMKIIPWTGDILAPGGGGSFSPSGGGTSWADSAVSPHRGGRISSEGRLTQYHTGGEINAKLLTGEGILNRTGMANVGSERLAKANSGQPIGDGGVIQIILAPVIKAWDTQDVLRNSKAIVAAMVNDLESNGRFKRAMRSA